jgi:hypothetical protein
LRAKVGLPRDSHYQSILESAEACDFAVGVMPKWFYEPEPLDKPADGNVLVCCSQPLRDVVIDL